MPNTRISDVHWGLAIPAIVLLATLALRAYGVLPFVRADLRGQRDLSMLCFVFCPAIIAVLVAMGFHLRCPACRGLFARRLLAKTFSHTDTREETSHEPDGGHATHTVSRKVYNGSFACRRCGHRWSGQL